MASKTTNFGFNFFGPDVPGSITDDSGKFTLGDRITLDRILKAFEVHDHSGGSATPDPTGPPPLSLDTESGTLPGGLNIYYRVSYVDQYGLESAASFEGVVTTPTPLVAPDIPILTGQAMPATPTGPGLGVGTYTYGVTALIAGQETPLGAVSSLDLAGDLPTVLVTFPDPQDTQDQWSVWRKGPADVGFTRLGTVDVTDTSFVDDGSVASNACADDPNQSPPTANLTASTNLVTIAAPDPDLVGAVDSLVKSWRIYRSFTSGVYPSSSLLADVTTTTDETSGALQTIFVDDGSLPLQNGQPLESSQVLEPSVPLRGGGNGAGALQVRSSDGLSTWAVSATLDGALVTDPSGLPAAAGNVFLVDANNVKWAVSVDADGSLRTTVGFPGPSDTVLTDGAMIATVDSTFAYLLTIAVDGALVTTAAGVSHITPAGPTTPFAFTTGTALPGTSGLPDGTPFMLDNGDGSATLFAILAGVWVSLSGPVTLSGFTDDFNRADTGLAGDNGWINGIGGSTVAPFAIAGNKVTATGSGGWDPILHLRHDGTPGVADVTVDYLYGSAGGPGVGGAFVVVCSDATHNNAIGITFDGNASDYGTPDFGIYRHLGADSSETPAVVTNHAWAGWTTGPMTLRLVYTEATQNLDVYQNGVLALSCDMRGDLTAGTGNFDYLDGDLPALSTMPYAGFGTGYGGSMDDFDNFICA